MKKNAIKTIIVYLIFVAIGMIGGIYLAGYMDRNGSSAFQFVYAYVWLVLAYFLAIIIHESGHLVAGLKSGYEFIFFRIKSMTFIKENGKLVRKKFSIAGTDGQCIMMPPESDTPEKVPFALYFLCGGLFNILASIICFSLGWLIDNTYIEIPLMVTGGVNAFLGIVNLIPINAQVPNDGYNVVNLAKNKSEWILMYKHLRINGLLHKGVAPSEIPEELFDFGEKNRGLGELLNASVCIDSKDFKKAEGLITSAIDSGKLFSIYELEAKSELLFCKIMNGAPDDEISTLYDKTLQKYIATSAKTQIAKRRILYAYNLLYKKDISEAQKEYDFAMKMKETYPNAGELKSELSLIQHVKNIEH